MTRLALAGKCAAFGASGLFAASAARAACSWASAATRDRVPAARHDREVWAAFCQAFFASAEFQYRR